MISKIKFESFKNILLHAGLNVVESISSDALHPEIPSVKDLFEISPKFQSLIFIGNGGPLLWKKFSPWWEEEELAGLKEEDPLDFYTRIHIEKARSELDFSKKDSCSVYPFLKEKIWINFQEIALEMKIVSPSPLGLGLHPKFGPWVSYRGILLLHHSLDPQVKTPYRENWNPCESCPAPCIEVCPAKAVSRRGTQLQTCYPYRLSLQSVCEKRCLSREACPLHPEEKFSLEQIHFHYKMKS